LKAHGEVIRFEQAISRVVKLAQGTKKTLMEWGCLLANPELTG
jgi:hypothetical protein